jgi:hypothetical protein
LGLVLGGLVVGAAAAEVVLRLSAPDAAADLLYNAPDNAPNGLYSTHATLYQVPTPGFSGVTDSLGYSVRLRINEQGLRGDALGPKQGPRWLALGDSFTMAAQVDEDDTFVSRLSAQTGLELLNAGVDGYATFSALARYEQLNAPLGIDGVLLTFFAGNDVHENMRWPAVQAEAARMRPGQPLARRAVNPVHGWLYKNSAAYAAFRMQQRRAQLSNPQFGEHHKWQSELRLFTGSGAGVLGVQMAQTTTALAALSAAITRGGDKLMVVLAPPAFQVLPKKLKASFELVGLDPSDARPDAVTDAVRSVLQRRGIAHCDLVGPLRAAVQRGQAPYLVHDGHWSVLGHEIAAAEMARCLAEQGWASGR